MSSRPPEPIYLAIEIGGSKLQLCAGTGDGKLLERIRITVNPAKGGEGIRAQIGSEVPALLSRHAPSAVAVGYGGPVHWRAGKVIKSHQISGWDDFPLGDWLGSLTGLPVSVENDSNSAAFGEAIVGAGRGFSPVFYTNLGSGVGGGLVVAGQLYHAAPPGEVEFGHVRLDREGTIVEDRCSGWAVDRRIRALLPTTPRSSLTARLHGSAPGGEARHLAAALEEGDELARRILDEVAADLAFALSHVVHLLHPAIIVIGGGLALIGESLRSAVASALPVHLMHAFRPAPEIALAALGEDAVPVGALALAARGHASQLSHAGESPS